MECEESWVDVFSVSMVVAVKGDNQKWVLTKVYGPTSGDQLEVFIAELQVIRWRRELPCVYGDISTRSYTWRKGIVQVRRRGMNDFCEFVDYNELINLSILRAQFTWSNF